MRTFGCYRHVEVQEIDRRGLIRQQLAQGVEHSRDHLVRVQRRRDARIDLVQRRQVMEVPPQLAIRAAQIGRVRFELDQLLLFAGHSDAAPSSVLNTRLTDGPALGRLIQRCQAQPTIGSASGGSAYASTSTPGMLVLQ